MSDATGETHKRPATVREKERFSSAGRPWLLILHGKWGARRR